MVSLLLMSSGAVLLFVLVAWISGLERRLEKLEGAKLRYYGLADETGDPEV